jgi:hypothetical protein
MNDQDNTNKIDSINIDRSSARNRSALSGRFVEKAAFFALIYVLGISLGFGLQLLRDMSNDTLTISTALESNNKAVPLLAAMPSLILLLFSMVRLKLRKRGAFTFYLTATALVLLAASIFMLAREWPNKMVLAYTLVPAGLLLLWIGMKVIKITPGRIFKDFFHVIGSMFWLSKDPRKVTKGQFSDILETFYLVVAGFALGAICDAGWIGLETGAWIWIGVLIFTILAVMPVFNIFHVIFILVVCGAAPLLEIWTMHSELWGRILGSHTDWLHDFFRHLAGLDLNYSGDFRQMAFLLSTVFAVLIPLSWLLTKIWKIHTFHAATVTKFEICRGVRTVVSGTDNVDARYANLLKFAFFGFKGNVICQDSNNVQKYTVRNVFLLPFCSDKIREVIKTGLVEQTDKDN